jgi:hypothetical protein
LAAKLSQEDPKAEANRTLMEVKDIPGKGKGLFAIEDIPCGTLVLTETPLIAININTADGLTAVSSAFSALSSRDQETYLQLHPYCPPIFTNEIRILETFGKAQAIYLANNWSGAVLNLGSRFNHSCIPNTQLVHNPKTTDYHFRALRLVKTGEELTVSYIDDFLSVEERQAKLERYGFQCRCPACEDSDAGRAIEEKRVKMMKIHHEVGNCTLSIQTPRAILQAHVKNLQQLLGLMNAVGLVSSLRKI